jgi:hypothetical protein
VTVERHDILPRTIALLLGLALFAERAALRPLAARLAMCQILLPGWHAALLLIDWPEDADKSQSVQNALDCSQHSDSSAMLLHLAIVFRAIAAVLMHACLTGGTTRRQTQHFAIMLSLNFPACRRLHRTIRPAPDTS